MSVCVSATKILDGTPIAHDSVFLFAVFSGGIQETGKPVFLFSPYLIGENGKHKTGKLKDEMRRLIMIHIIWPAESKIGVIANQWARLPDGCIDARYERPQLAAVLAMAMPLDGAETTLLAAYAAWDDLNRRGQIGAEYLQAHPDSVKARERLAELRRAEPALWATVEAARHRYEMAADLAAAI